MVESSAGEIVEIGPVEAAAFDAVLKYVYTVEEPLCRWNRDEFDHAKAVLSAADRFGVTGLKLRVEWKISNELLNASNAVDLMLFADAHSCALLKEAAFDVYLSHPKAVRASPEWALLKEALELFDELMYYVTVQSNAGSARLDQGLEDLKVSTLRRKCEAFGLSVDGTKETSSNDSKRNLQASTAIKKRTVTGQPKG